MQFNKYAQYACVSPCSNIHATGNTPDPTGGAVTPASSSDSDSDSSFAGWKIAVIVIACLVCVAIVLGVLFVVTNYM